MNIKYLAASLAGCLLGYVAAVADHGYAQQQQPQLPPQPERPAFTDAFTGNTNGGRLVPGFVYKKGKGGNAADYEFWVAENCTYDGPPPGGEPNDHPELFYCCKGYYTGSTRYGESVRTYHGQPVTGTAPGTPNNPCDSYPP